MNQEGTIAKERAVKKEKTINPERAMNPEETKKNERTFKPGELLPMLVDATLVIEKLRVQCQVRQSHLKLQGREDPETNDLFDRVQDLEGYVDDRIAELITRHPAYPWFRGVKGIGKENIAKIVGLVDIEKDDTASSLWAFCGFAPDPETGKAMRRQVGKKLTYNSQLRTMCWRLGSSLLRARGKYYDFYLVEKEKLEHRFEREEKSIVPASRLPTDERGKRREPDDMISEGHVHNMALRKMIKLFLAHLWVVWREGESLPVREPYAMEHLGHSSLINPWDMVDK